MVITLLYTYNGSKIIVLELFYKTKLTQRFIVISAFILLLYVCRHWLMLLMIRLLSINWRQPYSAAVYFLFHLEPMPSDIMSAIFFLLWKITVFFLNCLFLPLAADVDLSFVLHLRLCPGSKKCSHCLFAFIFFSFPIPMPLNHNICQNSRRKNKYSKESWLL